MIPVRLRAVVLAAGLGRRLRPLTDLVPKPLLPISGVAAAGHTLKQLAALGCEAAALNLHHLGDEIRSHFGRAVDGMPLTYSPEPEIQGTLGALVPLAPFLGEAELILVVNGDSVCRWPFAGLVRRHLKSGAAATLLMSKRADVKRFAGPVGLDRSGRIVSFRGVGGTGDEHRLRVFAGAHVFSPRLLAGQEARPADIVRDLYLPLLERGTPLRALETARPWHDLGTPERYLLAARRWPRGRWPLAALQARTWIGPGAQVHEDARLRRSVIERGARVDAGAEIERSLVLPGAWVGAGCRVRESIVGFATVLPPETQVDYRMVVPERADVTPRPADSVVGGLIYSPMSEGQRA